MKIVITDASTLTRADITPARLAAFGTVTAYDFTAPEEAAQRIGDADAVFCNKTVLGAEVFANCPRLCYVGECATGYNNIAIESAKAHGVAVCNAGAYSTEAVAQHTFALLLHHYNRVAAYDAAVRDGAWKRAKTFSLPLFPMEELAGKTLSVIGYGSIGRRVAAIGAAFGMKILVATRTTPVDCPYPLVSLDAAFQQGDVVTLHTPLTEQTAHMVDAKRLAMMKPNAIILNTARGGLIVEADLAYALKHGIIAGAALDVLTEEPMGDTPLYQLENCTITPHIAYAPEGTLRRLGDIVVENFRQYLAGTPQNCIVSPPKGETARS